MLSKEVRHVDPKIRRRSIFPPCPLNIRPLTVNLMRCFACFYHHTFTSACFPLSISPFLGISLAAIYHLLIYLNLTCKNKTWPTTPKEHTMWIEIKCILHHQGIKIIKDQNSNTRKFNALVWVMFHWNVSFGWNKWMGSQTQMEMVVGLDSGKMKGRVMVWRRD